MVAQRLDRHDLVLPAPGLLLTRWDHPRLADRCRVARDVELRCELLEPLAVLDGVEHRRAPVVRLRPGLDPEDGRRLAAEVERPVARVPDVRDVDRLRGLRVEVPVLPVEERALRQRRRAARP
jgi:hypothetical protein